MTTKKLNIKVDQKGAKKAEAEQQKLGKTIAKTIGQYVALGASVRMVGGFLIDSLKLYAQQELAEKKLTTALGYRSDALIKQAAALQKNSVYGDELIIESQALIAAFVKEESHIKAATKATLDFASAKGFDLKSAADLVSKTLGSSTNALTRYGIEVKGAVGSTERLRSLTENLGKAFGGQAKAEAGTLAGQIKQLANMYSDLKEDIGEVAAPAASAGVGMAKAAVGAVQSIGIFDIMKRSLFGLTASWLMLKSGVDAVTGGKEWTGSASTWRPATNAINEQAQRLKELEAAYQTFRTERLKTIADQQQLLEFEKRLNREFAISTDRAAKPIIPDMKALGYVTREIFKVGENGRIAWEQVQVLKKNLKQVSEIKVSANLVEANKAVDDIVLNIQQRYQTISNMTNTLIAAPLRGAFSEGTTALKAFGDAFLSLLTNLAVKAATFGILSSIFLPFSGAVGGFKKFMGFAQGGIIPEPVVGVGMQTGRGYTFAEQGPERVMPTGQSGASITINFNGNVTDQKYVDEFILPRIQRTLRLAR